MRHTATAKWSASFAWWTKSALTSLIWIWSDVPHVWKFKPLNRFVHFASQFGQLLTNWLDLLLFHWFFCSTNSHMTNHECCSVYWAGNVVSVISQWKQNLPARVWIFPAQQSSHTLIQNVAGLYHCAVMEKWRSLEWSFFRACLSMPILNPDPILAYIFLHNTAAQSTFKVSLL